MNRTQADSNCGVMNKIITIAIERLYNSTFDFLEIRKISVILMKLSESQVIFYMRRFCGMTLIEVRQNCPVHPLL